MTELAEVLRRRRTVRAYAADRPVPVELLDRVTAAAHRVPSAGFTQAVSLLVLTGTARRDAYWAAAAPGASGSRWRAGMGTAPARVLVWTSREAYLDRYAEPDKGWTDRDPDRWSAPYWYVDGGMAVLAMLLTATDLGLGAGFFGVPADRIGAVRAELGVPDDQLSVGVVSLGYAAEGGAAGSPARRVRKPAEELTHLEVW